MVDSRNSVLIILLIPGLVEVVVQKVQKASRVKDIGTAVTLLVFLDSGVRVKPHFPLAWRALRQC